mgnify:CR=1 FL=1
MPGKSLDASLKQWAEIREAVEGIRQGGRFKDVLFNGIGGSYLGPLMIVVGILGVDFNLRKGLGCLPSIPFPSPPTPPRKERDSKVLLVLVFLAGCSHSADEKNVLRIHCVCSVVTPHRPTSPHALCEQHRPRGIR